MDIAATIANNKIKEAIDNGEFDNIPGKGKPLQLEDMSGIPEDLRMGYKMLKNAGMLDEVNLKKDLLNLENLIDQCYDEEERERLKKKLDEKRLKYNSFVKSRKPSNAAAMRQYQSKIDSKFFGK